MPEPTSMTLKPVTPLKNSMPIVICRILAVACLAIPSFVGCARPQAVTTPPTRTIDHATFDVVLRACVREGGVDYLGLRRDYMVDLTRYLDDLATLDPTQLAALPADDRLALYLNAYNATVLYAVATRIRAGYSVAENDFALFKEPRVRIAGEVMSLDHLENEIIRKQSATPNVHAALVCASQSCPPLGNNAFAANNVTKVIDDRMKRFLNDDTKNKLDGDGTNVELSPIFEWYSQDFGGKDGVANHASKYLGEDIASANIAFGEYDWSLNLAPLEEDHPWRRVVADTPFVVVDGTVRNLVRDELVEELAPDQAHLDLVRIRLADGTVGHLPRSAIELFDPAAPSSRG